MKPPAPTSVPERLWHGQIPVAFTLDPSEVTTLHPPRPFYAMIPRMSYLVMQTRAVIEYFQDAAPPMAGGTSAMRIWFDYEGTPLKWHVPFGALVDLLASTNETLPLPLTVHFQGFPADTLLPCENEKVVESHYMHSVKQAIFLRTGTTKRIMALPEAQQGQIWTSVMQNDYHRFMDAARDLFEDDSAIDTQRSVPVRVHLRNEPVIQMPIAPRDASSGQDQTLGDVLRYLLPDLYTPEHEPRVVMHGIPVPTHLSIVQLYQQFVYPDGFVHVCVLPAQS